MTNIRHNDVSDRELPASARTIRDDETTADYLARLERAREQVRQERAWRAFGGRGELRRASDD